MDPCRRLTTTTHHPVPPVTLRTGAWGDPTVGHLATEHLQPLQQDPPQSLQLPLATAGTHGVPRDEIAVGGGSCGKNMDMLIYPCFFLKYINISAPSHHSPCWLAKLWIMDMSWSLSGRVVLSLLYLSSHCKLSKTHLCSFKLHTLLDALSSPNLCWGKLGCHLNQKPHFCFLVEKALSWWKWTECTSKLLQTGLLPLNRTVSEVTLKGKVLV